MKTENEQRVSIKPLGIQGYFCISFFFLMCGIVLVCCIENNYLISLKQYATIFSKKYL